MGMLELSRVKDENVSLKGQVERMSDEIDKMRRVEQLNKMMEGELRRGKIRIKELEMQVEAFLRVEQGYKGYHEEMCERVRKAEERARESFQKYVNS